ncbi:hypothetical protein AMTRI_Chr10g231680 [Amborella trichopoda]
MDSSDKDKFGLDKGNTDHLDYPSSTAPPMWRFPIPPLNMVSSDNPHIWDSHSTMAHNLTFHENSLQTSSSSLNATAMREIVSGSPKLGTEGEIGVGRGFEMGWNPLNSMPKGGLFIPTGGPIAPQTLAQFSTDSAFVERAARFSCFNGDFSDIITPFSVPDVMNSYTKNGGLQNQMPEILNHNTVTLASNGAQTENNKMDGAEASREISSSRPLDTSIEACETNFGGMLMASAQKNGDEEREAIGATNNESDGAEFSGGQDERPSSVENASMSRTLKKRKRSTQAEDQMEGALNASSDIPNESVDAKLSGDQNPNPNASKSAAKQEKDHSQNPDTPKEDYIHVRARRGQATNSHSLAERVRREKISERMKFLQDLVPGCNKVTGKAVMLDEIINYVQSLQRQVEFLSMKLAAVNPRLDFNLEGLLQKDILQARGSTSTSVGFTPDMNMAHPHMHPPQQGLVQMGIPGVANPVEMLRRTMNPHLNTMNGYKDSATQVANVWDDDLHNVVQMSFGPSIPFSTQELNGSIPPSHMKVEL